TLLVAVEECERAGIQEDEWLVHPVGAGVDERRLGDEERVSFGRVECLQYLEVAMVQVGELTLGDPDGVGLEGQADGLLSEQAEDLLEYLVECGHAAQRGQGGAVGRVFPCAGINVLEDATR